MLRDIVASQKKHEDHMAKMDKVMGSWRNSFGNFAEEYFINSFGRGEKTFFGEHFDEIENNMGYKKSKSEYDIVLINEKSIGIIEVKFRCRIENIAKILEKPNTFREDFPEYKNHKIYLGLAGLSFEDEVDRECADQGIAIIKQIGDKVVIYDKRLKTF
jgi:hypothetical protein